MDANKRKTQRNGQRTLARRAITIMLSFIMVFTMMPWLTPEQGQAAAAVTLQWPVPGHRNLTGKFGYYWDYSKKCFVSADHWAIDINDSSIEGANVYAAAAGKVIAIFNCEKQHKGLLGDCNGFGTGLVIRSKDGRMYQYAHMMEGSIPPKVYYGATVEKGQLVGKVGKTGAATGPHLHFQISSGGSDYSKNAVDPESFSYTYDKPTINQYPVGIVRNCITAPGTLTVKGWAYDPDNTNKAVEVRAYYKKKDGSYVFLGKSKANKKNENYKKYKAGVNHWFEFTMNVNDFPEGKKNIFIKALNIDKSGNLTGNDVWLKKTGIGNQKPSKNAWSVEFKKKANYKVITGDADNATNTTADISGSLQPAGNVSSWGFYLGKSDSDMNQHKYTASLSTTSSGNMIYTQYGLEPGTTYHYKVWAKICGKEITGSKKTFSTSSDKPDIPVLKVDNKTQEIGIGDVAVFKWSKAKNADYYNLYIYDENGDLVSVRENITGETCSSEAIQKEGTYTARIESYNSVGTKGKSEEVSFEVHPNVFVTFYDADDFVDVNGSYEPEFLGKYEVPWGHDSEVPSDPSHTGYTFKGWSETCKGVTEDTEVQAVYDINKYTATFVDSQTGNTLKTQTNVSYCSSASPPDYSVGGEYVKLGYNGWDKDYSCITEDTTFYTCTGWYDEELPIYATIVNAVREYDADSSDDEGYTVTLSLTNWDAGTTKGRVVVALKTREGKLLTSTESAAFTIKKSATKELEVFVPYENAASIAEAYVIGQYKDVVPIAGTSSNNTSFEIDQSNTMTNWSTEQPPAGAGNVESRTEYRYKDKLTTTSYSTSLAGYTQDGGSWVKQDSGKIDYIASFPSGFNKSSAYYTKYNVKPKTASETATDKTTVSTSTIAYIYWHWCRGDTSGPGNRLINDCKEGAYTHWHSFNQSSMITWDSSAKAFYSKKADTCKDSYWWVAYSASKSTQLPVKRCTYNTYKRLFNYYKWTDWSDWSTTPATASENKEVETRTVYRYQVSGAMDEDTSGDPITISGNVDPSFSGKEATLFVYKINEASDFTNEYVDQTVIGDNGHYEFNFKLREEPSDVTGDFTIALGIQGTTTPIYLDPGDEYREYFEAPKKKYTVKYYDDYYEDFSSVEPIFTVEEVEENGSAALPDEDILKEIFENKAKDGQTFIGWSETNINITGDKAIYPLFKNNVYTVVFVDWQAKTVSMEKYEHGQTLMLPQPEQPDESMTVEWDGVTEGQTVTSDMVVTTKYTDKMLDVKVYDEDSQTYETQKVKYGMTVDLPEIEDTAKKEFLGWEDISGESPEGLTDTIMTRNAILCPVYSYNETVADPTASLEQGVYDSVKTVTLSCDTPGADIYYTLDGSSPTSLDSTLYTGPIEIDGPTELKFYASKFEMNDSDIQTRLYSVNYDGATSKWMLEEDLPQAVVDDWDAYNVQMRTGYRYKDTRSVTTLAEAAALEASGWSSDSEAEAAYDDFTDWSDEMPLDTDEYINVDIESKPVYTSADQFTYSHYVYEDGVTKYSPTPVDGFECTQEELGPFDEPLNVAGKDANGNWYYSYDGQNWYNQQETSGQVQTGAKYRWRHQIVEYTKWSDWTTSRPGADEQREYESANIFNYARHNYYLVNVHFDDHTWAYLAEEGSLASIENDDVDDLYAYDVEGVFTDENYTTAFDLENDTITANTDLYVKAAIRSFEVKFVDLDGNELSTQSVNYQEAATPPEAPSVEGYRFIKWKNDDYTSVDYDMTLYPEYIPEDEYATVALDNESLTLYKDKSAELTAIITPLSKSDTELTWTSSDESVACVSDTGRVTGLDGGTADITVMVDETGETATCTVTVKVDNSSSLILIKNDKLSIDSNGYLRGAKGNKDTVADIIAYFDNANVTCVDAEGAAMDPDALFGTGYKIQLVVNGTVKDTLEGVVTGDFNGDGSINNKDVALLLRHLMNKVTPSPAQVLAADTNGDGEVNARDAVLISRVIVGKASIE